MTKILNLALIFFVTFTLVSCEQRQVKRKYQEIVIAPPQNSTGVASDSSLMNQENLPPSFVRDRLDILKPKITWQNPGGWLEKPGEGFRLVTFYTTGEDPMECLISSIGFIGDIIFNIQRWMQQIKMDDPSGEKSVKAYEQGEKLPTEGGLTAFIIDLTKFQDNEPDDVPSMIVATIPLSRNGQGEIVIKLTGTKKTVLENFEKFKALCQSIKDQP